MPHFALASIKQHRPVGIRCPSTCAIALRENADSRAENGIAREAGRAYVKGGMARRGVARQIEVRSGETRRGAAGAVR